ncbi:MAG: NADH-quinone oxidoreductase subunit L [Chloroflexi bacterium]|nr:NADH-quinone oxidoreductase subunit L [Chloroflexota bacterium]
MTLDELIPFAESELEEREQYEHEIHVCVSSSCHSSNSEAIKDAIQAEIDAKGMSKTCRVKGVGCMGICAAGPMVAVDPDGVLYEQITPDHAADIVATIDKSPDERLSHPTDTPFFNRQFKIVLENAGKIDPNSIQDYIAADGYTALYKVLNEVMPKGVISRMMRSGLRGRGGAGYPAGLKWSTVAKAKGERKFVICNGDEGDPGAFMDRSIMEADPHRILEGMAIAAYAVGADQGYIYVRAEYPLAIKRLKNAIRQAKKLGFLGDNIFDTPFSFNVDIRLGAGAFVCGEETALIASVEGGRGNPRPRPPYPAAYGLWGYPTLINNAETLANVPSIMRHGAGWFSAIGTEGSKGTKVFALSGRVKNIGLIEVPMGITLREIIFDIGGGIPDGKKFKAVQTGGPSGGCIPEEYLDMPVEYESLKELGSIMGSGGMIVMDETSSMVDVAKYFMEFSMSESCGKCIPCRVGTRQMHDLLDRISKGMGTTHDLHQLEELCDMVQATSLCGLGQSAPNPVVSTLRYFRHEYLELLTDYDPDAAVAADETSEVTQ